jgi:hypothetical protein
MRFERGRRDERNMVELWTAKFIVKLMTIENKIWLESLKFCQNLKKFAFNSTRIERL